ncbi:MAG TPA: riboflavin synthase subunit alpha [Oligoflexia bacterium]|nr:riboflavin synthase subunit alpha [Oligoflexia bacterium]HMP27610.1 riboflavin synthase subunit alpha [Oligoflexia bacterium]
MFSGIVFGHFEVLNLTRLKQFARLQVKISPEFQEKFSTNIGQSIAVDGVCLTITNNQNLTLTFDVISETLAKTTLGELKVKDTVNLEGSLNFGDPIGGHLLSGHVDGKAEIINIENPPNNYILTIKPPTDLTRFIFNKGYVALNGASLTVCDANREQSTFKIYLIPETLKKTSFANKKIGDKINIEVDKNTQTLVETTYAILSEFLKQHKDQLISATQQQTSLLSQ